MHSTASQFIKSAKKLYPQHFDNQDFQALDVGSLDVNGSNDDFFSKPANLLGIDVTTGPSVDLVCKAHLFTAEKPFRTVICTSMLEHDEHWQESIANMVRLTEPGGLLVITCAGPGYKEHCTPRFPVKGRDGRLVMLDHYRNVSVEDLQPLLRPFFDPLFFQYLEPTHDTFFWGIRKCN